MKTRTFNLIMICLITAILASGCLSVRVPHKKSEHYRETVVSLEPDLAYFDIKGLPAELQTTGVHPDDSSFLQGETTTDLQGGESGIMRLGLEQQIGSKKWRFKYGLDTRIRISELFEDDRDYGFYDIEKQSSDTRPNSNASFVYTTLDWQTFNFMPFVGVERVWHPNGKWLFHWALEAGIPRGAFVVESGHDRFGEWSSVRTTKWEGFGQRYAAEIGGESSSLYQLTLGAAWENYEAEFLGKTTTIEGWTFYFRIFTF